MIRPMPNILIVDDEPETCRVMSRLFARRGWSSDYVHAAGDALAAIRSGRPDAVLLDASMPGMGGFDVLAAVRGDPAAAGVAVLFYAAAHDGEAADRAMDAGADDYIPKLTSAGAVADRVGLFMDARAGGSAPPRSAHRAGPPCPDGHRPAGGRARVRPSC